jgi:hypothetical protein
VTFAHGKISGAKKGAFGACGCPAPPATALPARAANSATLPAAPPVEQKLPQETHVQMETPMVYEGGGSAAPVASPSRLTTESANQGSAEIAEIKETAAPGSKALAVPQTPAATPPAAEKPGFFRRLGRFFSRTLGNG